MGVRRGHHGCDTTWRAPDQPVPLFFLLPRWGGRNREHVNCWFCKSWQCPLALSSWYVRGFIFLSTKLKRPRTFILIFVREKNKLNNKIFVLNISSLMRKPLSFSSETNRWPFLPAARPPFPPSFPSHFLLLHGHPTLSPISANSREQRNRRGRTG